MYDILMIDPPWPKKKGGLRKVTPNQTRELDYPTMPVDDIFKLLDNDVFCQSEPIHTVFMWTIDQFLFDCEKEMISRGYKRHARMIWDKGNGVAPAFTIRYCHEYLIWFYKPKMIKVCTSMRGKLSTVFREGNRQHSRKPNIAYHIIEKLYPEAKRIDVFSREKREGWDQYGNEPDRFNIQ